MSEAGKPLFTAGSSVRLGRSLNASVTGVPVTEEEHSLLNRIYDETWQSAFDLSLSDLEARYRMTEDLRLLVRESMDSQRKALESWKDQESDAFSEWEQDYTKTVRHLRQIEERARVLNLLRAYHAEGRMPPPEPPKPETSNLLPFLPPGKVDEARKDRSAYDEYWQRTDAGEDKAKVRNEVMERYGYSEAEFKRAVYPRSKGTGSKT